VEQIAANFGAALMRADAAKASHTGIVECSGTVPQRPFMGVLDVRK
jgi:hypothetical protein